MDIGHLPIISYFIDWQNVAAVYAFGFIGLSIASAFGVILYRQMRDQDGGP